MKLYGLDMSKFSFYTDNTDGLTFGRSFDYSKIEMLDWANIPPIDEIPEFPKMVEYYYPTTTLAADKKYHWSVLCNRIYDDQDPPQPTDQVKVIVFVSRLGGTGIQYPANLIPEDGIDPNIPLPLPEAIDYPEPFMISELYWDAGDVTEKTLTVPTEYKSYFREGSTVVDDRNGNVYTVQEVKVAGSVTIVLDRPFAFIANAVPYKVWVIPSSIKNDTISPAVLGGRWPCVWVEQDIIKF
jgi:hypothetical protein